MLVRVLFTWYVSMQAEDFKRAKHVPAAIVNLSLMLDCFSWMTLNNLSEVTWTEQIYSCQMVHNLDVE